MQRNQKCKGHIDFEHVAFAYDPDSPVLSDVHFSIKAGQRIGICGPTGGGKSTVVSLIPRFYDPTKGTVKIDGVDITDYQFMEIKDCVIRLHLCYRIQFVFWNNQGQYCLW